MIFKPDKKLSAIVFTAISVCFMQTGYVHANTTTSVHEPCRSGYIITNGVCHKPSPYRIRDPEPVRIDINAAVREAVSSYGGPMQGASITKLQSALAANPTSGRQAAMEALKREAKAGFPAEKHARGVAMLMGMDLPQAPTKDIHRPYCRPNNSDRCLYGT